ncbi:MAG: hypothetical protein JEZ04_19720 [Spirochaetales bacterium]|nr:hypothetical protein [Spirochaetales bacterium]
MAIILMVAAAALLIERLVPRSDIKSEEAEAVLNKEKTLEDCVFLSREKIGEQV